MKHKRRSTTGPIAYSDTLRMQNTHIVIVSLVVVDHFYRAILCSLANSLHSCHTWSWMSDCSLFQHIEYPWNRIHTLHHCKCCISLSYRTILGSWVGSQWSHWMWLWMCDCSPLFLFFNIHWTKCTHCIICHCISLSHRTILGSWTGWLCSGHMQFWMSEHSLFQHVFEYPLNKTHTLYH